MGDFLRIEVIIYHMFVNIMSIMWIFYNVVYMWIPKPIVDVLEDTHVQGVFKGATGFVIGVFLVIQKGYDMVHARKKHKMNIEKHHRYLIHIATGDRLRDHRLYIKAEAEYIKALALDYDNEKAQLKINEAKRLQDEQ